MLEASLVLLAAALTAMFARDIYFLQREYELVIARYLDNGIDKVLAELDEITAAFNHNWSQIIILLRNFDDAGEGFDLDQLKTDFLRVNFSGLNAVAHYRIRVLVGNNEYWSVYQKALAYYAQANSVFTSEIPEVVRLKVAGHPSVAHQTVRDVVEAGMNEALRHALAFFYEALRRGLPRRRFRLRHRRPTVNRRSSLMQPGSRMKRCLLW